MKFRTFFCFILLQFSLAIARAQASNEKPALDDLQRRVQSLEQELQARETRHNYELNDLKNKVTSYAPMGMLLFLFGAVCALWAQDNGRSAWAWFFTGLLLNVLALIMVLAINSGNNKNSNN